jgi:hypothetical protein
MNEFIFPHRFQNGGGNFCFTLTHELNFSSKKQLISETIQPHLQYYR